MFFSVAYWQQEMMYGIEPEFGDMTGQGEVRYAKRNTSSEEDFDYSALNWAIDSGIINKKDIAIFERTINNEIYRGAEPHSANGEYIIDTGKCLMFTDGDFHRPTLSRVIEFATEYESLTDYAKRRIIDEAEATGEVQQSLQAVEIIFGQGFVSSHVPPAGYTHAGQNRGRKGSNGSRTNQKARSLKERFGEDGLDHLLEDNGSFLDIAYMNALNRGDMETVQQMVDEAAKTVGFTIKAYHGTPIKGITVFDNTKIGSTTDDGIFGHGFYFATKKLTADGYATVDGETMPVFLRVNKPWWGLGHNIQEVAEQLELDESMLTVRKVGKRSSVVAPMIKFARTFSSKLIENGYDSVIVQHGKHNYEIVVFDNSKIKSADPVTYDDDGNVIPLSKRFDSTNNDIRYSDRDYSYDALSKKPDMVVTTVGGNIPKNRADIVAVAKKNAASVGRLDPKTGSISVHVKDIGRDVGIGRDGLKHSIDRRIDVNAPVLLKAGEIISNSIRINELTPKKERIDESYVLIGAARNADNELYIVRSVVNRFSHNLVSMDVLYAINAKKEPAALLPLSTEKPALGTDSKISIAELLDYVNRYFPDILPEEVLKHYGHDFRPKGELGEAALYSDRSTESVSNRTLLADALESTTQHDVERKKLQEYKSKMPNKDVAEIQSLIKHEAKTTDNYLGIDVKWLYNTEKGHEYFAIYSTTNVKDPTILYASKGKSANREYKFVQEFPKREEQRYGQDYGAGGLVGQLLSRFKDAASWQNVYDRNTARSGSSSRNGAVYSQNRRDKLNAAFLSCIKNISETQLQASIDERYQFAVDRGDLKTAQRMVDEAAEAAGYSIKGYYGRVNSYSEKGNSNKL